MMNIRRQIVQYDAEALAFRIPCVVTRYVGPPVLYGCDAVIHPLEPYGTGHLFDIPDADFRSDFSFLSSTVKGIGIALQLHPGPYIIVDIIQREPDRICIPRMIHRLDDKLGVKQAVIHTAVKSYVDHISLAAVDLGYGNILPCGRCFVIVVCRNGYSADAVFKLIGGPVRVVHFVFPSEHTLQPVCSADIFVTAGPCDIGNDQREIKLTGAGAARMGQRGIAAPVLRNSFTRSHRGCGNIEPQLLLRHDAVSSLVDEFRVFIVWVPPAVGQNKCRVGGINPVDANGLIPCGRVNQRLITGLNGIFEIELFPVVGVGF